MLLLSSIHANGHRWRLFSGTGCFERHRLFCSKTKVLVVILSRSSAWALLTKIEVFLSVPQSAFTITPSWHFAHGSYGFITYSHQELHPRMTSLQPEQRCHPWAFCDNQTIAYNKILFLIKIKLKKRISIALDSCVWGFNLF